MPSFLRQPLFLLPLSVFALFLGVYLCSGDKMKVTDMYHRDDVFFRADTRRAWADLVGDRNQSHRYTSGHPNFVIFHQPIGYLLREYWKKNVKYTPANASQDIEAKRARKMEGIKFASVILTALAGAGTAALFCALLLSMGLSNVRSVLFTGVLGFSTTHLFFSSSPETYIFSALGIVAVALLAVRSKSHAFWWQLAAVYACSMLTTNIALVGLWTLVRCREEPTLIKWFLRVCQSLAITVVLLISLNIVQKLIYPTAVLVFLPSSVGHQTGWFYWEQLLSPLKHTRILLQHIWLSNIVAPEPVVARPFGINMASIEAGTWNQFAAAWPLFGLWLTILVASLAGLARRAWHHPAILAALAIIAFNFCFFFIFGHDRMLYSCLWTAMSVLMIAYGCECLIRRWPAVQKYLTVMLSLFVLCQAWHNWHFLTKIMLLVQ